MKRKMTDLEIYEFFYNLTPENELQKKQIHKVMRIFLKKNHYTGIGESERFLEALNENDVIDKTSKEIYEEYKYWCKLEKVKPVAKNVFGSAVMERFNVKNKVIRINGKCTRVYKK